MSVDEGHSVEERPNRTARFATWTLGLALAASGIYLALTFDRRQIRMPVPNAVFIRDAPPSIAQIEQIAHQCEVIGLETSTPPTYGDYLLYMDFKGTTRSNYERIAAVLATDRKWKINRKPTGALRAAQGEWEFTLTATPSGEVYG